MLTLPKRYLRLHLYKDSKDKKTLNFLTENVRVTFNLSAAVSGAFVEANINIYGLNVAKMFSLTTSTTLWVKNWVQHRIVIDAGYEDRHGIIFDGTIMEAKTSLSSADYSVSIKATTGFDKISVASSYNFPGAVSVREIAKQIAKENDLVLVDGLKDDKIKITDFSIRSQNLQNICRTISNSLPVNLYLEAGRLYLKKKGQALKSSVLKISHDLIVGIPDPSQTGVKVKIRLIPNIVSGQEVQIESLKYPELSKIKFFLDAIAINGDTMGNDWTAELSLTKKGLGTYED